MGTIRKDDAFSVPQGFTANQMAKAIANKYGVNSADFEYDRLSKKLFYRPKKKVVYSKPEKMSVQEYFDTIVLANNKELAAKVAMFEDEVWMPIINIGRYFGGDVDYSGFYEVSNKGRIKMIDCGNAMRSDISVGYDTPTRNAMQFTLNDRNGKRTTSDVKYMVADAFLGEHDIKLNEVIHIDGDYHNNEATNLMWVER